MTAANYKLPIGEIIGKAWDKVYGAKGTMWAAFAITFGLMFVLGIIDGIIHAALPTIEPFYNFLMQVVAFLLQMGILYIGINRAKDLPINYSQMFRAFESGIMIRIIGLYILQIIVLIIPIALAAFSMLASMATLPGGTITNIILGTIAVLAIIIITVRMMFSMAFVLDKTMNPWEAIKASFAITNGNFWRLVFITAAESIIIAISAIPLGLGLIWSLPFVIILYGLMYKELAEKNA